MKTSWGGRAPVRRATVTSTQGACEDGSSGIAACGCSIDGRRAKGDDAFSHRRFA